MGQHAGRVARAKVGADLLEVAIGPVDDDLVGHREAGRSSEDGAGIADRHAVAEDLGDPRRGRR